MVEVPTLGGAVYDVNGVWVTGWTQANGHVEQAGVMAG